MMSCADDGCGRFPSADEGDGGHRSARGSSFQTDLLKMLNDVINTTTETAQSVKIALSPSVQYKNSTFSLVEKHADQNSNKYVQSIRRNLILHI